MLLSLSACQKRVQPAEAFIPVESRYELSYVVSEDIGVTQVLSDGLSTYFHVTPQETVKDKTFLVASGKRQELKRDPFQTLIKVPFVNPPFQLERRGKVATVSKEES